MWGSGFVARDYWLVDFGFGLAIDLMDIAGFGRVNRRNWRGVGLVSLFEDRFKLLVSIARLFGGFAVQQFAEKFR